MSFTATDLRAASPLDVIDVTIEAAAMLVGWKLVKSSSSGVL